MKIVNLQYILKGLMRYYLARCRTPLVVSYLSTYTCNQKCEYCNWTKLEHRELSTEQAIELIVSMKKSGVVKLGFAGGESLNRKDIDILLECSHQCGLITSISSNGKKIAEHIDAINKYVDVVQLSLDGTQRVHDSLREEHSYQHVIKSLELLKKNEKKVITNTVLTKKNIKELPSIIALAKEYNYKALFQPVFNYQISEEAGVIDSLSPSYYEMFYATEYLINQKKIGHNVGNSIAFLRYIQKTWDIPDGIKCRANHLFCSVDPQGYVIPCCFDNSKHEYANAIIYGFKKAFDNSINNQFSNNCKGCYCNAYMEENLAFSFYPSACINALDII